MTPIEIGLISVIAIVFLIYSGVYIPVALGVVSFISIWLMRDNFTLALNLLKVAVGDSAMEYTFATIPLFTFMGLIVSKAGRYCAAPKAARPAAAATPGFSIISAISS